jgi:predicted transcriptional regulator
MANDWKMSDGMDRLEEQAEKEQRDMAILQAVVEDGPIGIVRLAEETDLPEHKVRYSLRMLENDDLIEPTPNGAIPADDIDAEIEAINAGLDRLVERLEAIRDVA